MERNQPSDGHVRRWLQALADFDFLIIHRAGKQHGNADALSRAPHISKQPPAAHSLGDDEEPGALKSTHLAALRQDIINQMSERERHAEMQETSASNLRPTKFDRLHICKISSVPFPGGMTNDDLVDHQKADKVLKEVRRWATPSDIPEQTPDLRAMHPHCRVYHSMLHHLEILPNGLLILKAPDPLTLKGELQLVCLPFELWDPTILHIHEMGGHMGINVTLQRLNRRVYFPGMKKEIAAALNRCGPCHRKRRAPKGQRHTLVAPVEGFPFQRISLDFVGPLTPSRRGHSYILTIRDTFTKWFEAFPTRHQRATDVVRVLHDQICCRFGIPHSIHTDQGTPFMAALTTEVARALGIKKTSTVPYNPKANPVERVHRLLGEMLRALSKDDPKAWDEVLPQAVFAINSAVNSTTGFSAHQLLFGRDPATPLDLLFGSPPTLLSRDPSVGEAYAMKLKKGLEDAHAYARDNIGSAVRRQRRLYHQQAKEFMVGDKVWLFTPRGVPEVSRKLSTYWSGPWTILEKLNELTYRLSPLAEWGFRKSYQDATIDRLLPFIPPHDGRRVNLPPDLSADLDMPGDAFAECIDDPAAAPPLPDDDNDDDEAAGSGGGIYPGAAGGGAGGTITPRPPPAPRPQPPPQKPAAPVPPAAPTPPTPPLHPHPAGTPPTQSPPPRPTSSTRRRLRFRSISPSSSSSPSPPPSPIAHRTRSRSHLPSPTVGEWDDYLPTPYPEPTPSTGARPKDRARSSARGRTVEQPNFDDVISEEQQQHPEQPTDDINYDDEFEFGDRTDASWLYVPPTDTDKDEFTLRRNVMDEIEEESDADNDNPTDTNANENLYPDLTVADTEEAKEEGRRLRAREELRRPVRYEDEYY